MVLTTLLPFKESTSDFNMILESQEALPHRKGRLYLLVPPAMSKYNSELVLLHACSHSLEFRMQCVFPCFRTFCFRFQDKTVKKCFMNKLKARDVRTILCHFVFLFSK